MSAVSKLPNDQVLDLVAMKCFRDVADSDYIAARIAFISGLPIQFLWSSQQAIEKYLKCILLLKRIPAKHIRHDLKLALGMIEREGELELDLSKSTRIFIDHIDEYGRSRYLEKSSFQGVLDLDIALHQKVRISLS